MGSRFNNFLFRTANTLLKPLYKVYEKWLWQQIKNGPVPEHIAIIPDGNRRWATVLGIEPWKGHYYGYNKVKDVLNWCWELGVKIVTIYALSTENLRNRDKKELEELFKIFERGFKEIAESSHIHEKKVRVKVIGRKNMLPESIIDLVRRVEKETENYDSHYLNIALGYGGRAEITDAVKMLVEDALNGKIKLEEINENLISKYLYTRDLPKPDPDLIIRTSGEERLSGFLLWQSAYSELYFCDVYWPGFRKIDFWRAIRSFQKRERRFGK